MGGQSAPGGNSRRRDLSTRLAICRQSPAALLPPDDSGLLRHGRAVARDAAIRLTGGSDPVWIGGHPLDLPGSRTAVCGRPADSDGRPDVRGLSDTSLV